MPDDLPATIADWLQTQLELQLSAFDNDPRWLADGPRAEFLRWNAFALEDEIHEAMQEVGWKPWASDKFFNRDAFMDEMVDAFHFFGNMLLTAWNPDHTTARGFAAEFFARYQLKAEVNMERQRKGYTGREKCSHCSREFIQAEITGDGKIRGECPEHGWVFAR